MPDAMAPMIRRMGGSPGSPNDSECRTAPFVFTFMDFMDLMA